MLINTQGNISLDFESTTTVYCQHRRKIYQNLDTNARIVLTSCFSVIGVIGVLVNLLVIFIIHRTKQLDVQSVQLFRNFSILDAFTSIINFVHLKAILDPNQAGCEVYYVLSFLLHWAIYSSSFMVLITGLDRYIHIKYLKDYKIIFTPLRFKVVLVLYFICIIYQSSITAFMLISKGPVTAGPYTMPLNVFGLIGIIYFYSKSIFILKKHSADTITTLSTKKSIVKIAVLYFYFYLFNIAILLVYQALANWTGALNNVDLSTQSVLGTVYSIFPTLTAIVNAFAFLLINTKSRNWLKSFFTSNRVFNSSKIHSSSNESSKNTSWNQHDKTVL